MNFMQNVCIYVLFSATKLHSFHHILKAIRGPKKLGTHVLEWHQNTLAKVIQSLKKNKNNLKWFPGNGYPSSVHGYHERHC